MRSKAMNLNHWGFFAFACLASLLGEGFAEDAQPPPAFEWDETNMSPAGVPLLIIKFPDGGPNDAAILDHYNPFPKSENETEEVDNCIFMGFLRDEHNVSVALTGCPKMDTLNIQFASSRLENDMFSVENGTVSIVHPPVGKERGSLKYMLRDIALKSAELEREFPITEEDSLSRNVPRNGFYLPISLTFDSSWYNTFGSGSYNAMRRVVAFAQNLYNWSSLESRIVFQVSEERQWTAQRWIASDPWLRYVSQFNYNSNIYAYAYLSIGNSGDNVGGIGWIAGTCSSALYWRTTITEYHYNDMNTGNIFAHEIGHNLGMDHDFIGDNINNYRYENGWQCGNVGGVMDYRFPPRKWSPCSLGDYNRYYNAVVRQRGSFCLRQI